MCWHDAGYFSQPAIFFSSEEKSLASILPVFKLPVESFKIFNSEKRINSIIKINQQLYFLFNSWILVNDFPETGRRAENILCKCVYVVLYA